MLEESITFLYILLAFLIWVDLIILLDKLKILKRLNMSRIWVIALMWRTKKGIGLIDKISSPKKFWTWIGNVGYVLFFTGMLLMFILIALSALITLTNPTVKAVGAKEVLVLPGINPYVPFIYGLIGLIVAVVVHEFSHGIIARVEGFKVKALGLLFILIPMGAFMEPDDKEVEKGPRKSRIRMFTAGPISNFFLAFLFLGIFSWGFMGSLEAPGDPYIITDLAETSPLYIGMDEPPKAIYSINGTEIHNGDDLYHIEVAYPGNWVEIEMKVNGGRTTVPLRAGLLISTVLDDTPAEDAGIREGSIIRSIDDRIVLNYETFHNIMDNTSADQIIKMELLEPIFDVNDQNIQMNDQPPKSLAEPDFSMKYPDYMVVNYNVTLDDKYDHIPMKGNREKGYIGIASSFLGVAGMGSNDFLGKISNPIANGNGFAGKFKNTIYITFILPLETSKMPFHDPLTDIYEIQGPLGILPEGVFWFAANTIFYIFWINILLGLFNALPMVPLDGGFVFRDTMVLILGKFSKKTPEEKLENISKNISKYTSFLVLSLILISIFFPWVRVLFLG